MNNYKCPKCKAINSGKEWDVKTKEYYDEDEDLTLIEEEIKATLYYCPSCGKESEFGYGVCCITNAEEEYIMITKKEYDELIAIKWKYVDLGKINR